MIDDDVRDRARRTLAEMELRDRARGDLRQQQDNEVAELTRLYGPDTEEIRTLIAVHGIESECIAYLSETGPSAHQ